MRKPFLLFTFVALLLIQTSWVYGQPNTLDVPILEEGETVRGEFETNADAQLYAFNGSEGDVVTITMDKADDTDLDPLLILLDEVGEVVASNDDRRQNDRSSEIEDAELPRDGTYFVVAMTYIGLLSTDEANDEDAPYTYDLTVSNFTVPSSREDNSIRYSGIVASYGTPVELSINRDAPVFYVSFDGSEGDIVDISTTLSGEEDDVRDTMLYLFAPDGRRIAVNDDPQRGELAAALDGIELPQDGRYIIFATSFFFHDITFLEENDGLWFDGSFELEIDN